MFLCEREEIWFGSLMADAVDRSVIVLGSCGWIDLVHVMRF
jgi:hypothetical protein